MWEDKYRKIVRSKPIARSSPRSKPRWSALWGSLGPSLFRKRRIHFMGFAAFFLVGILCGVLFGPSSGPLDPPQRPAPDPSAVAEVPDRPFEDSNREGRPVRLKAYAYTSPSPQSTNGTAAEVPLLPDPTIDAPPVSALPADTPESSETRRDQHAPSSGPLTGKADAPQWLAYAVPEPSDAAEPRIALVIDDLGIDQARTRKAIGLAGPLTMAFLPYGYNLAKLSRAAREAGHELIVHLPMQPQNDDSDPGPNALARDLSPVDLRERIAWNLSRFEGFVGINNHMGSGFTRWDAGVAVLMQEVRSRGLLFLDSLTSKDSVAGRIAAQLDVPFAVRDVFLDNEQEVVEISKQLDKLEAIARKRGYAIGIGHPHDATIETLRAWLPGAKARGLSIVPLSTIVKHRRASG